MKKWLVGGAIVAYFLTCLLFPMVSVITMGVFFFGAVAYSVKLIADIICD